MKKTGMKTLTVVLCCMLLLCMSLAGCSQKSDDTKKDTETKTETDSKETKETEEEDPNDVSWAPEALDDFFMQPLTGCEIIYDNQYSDGTVDSSSSVSVLDRDAGIQKWTATSTYDGTTFTNDMYTEYRDGKPYEYTVDPSTGQAACYPSEEALGIDDIDVMGELEDYSKNEYTFVSEEAVDGVDCIKVHVVSEKSIYDMIMEGYPDQSVTEESLRAVEGGNEAVDAAKNAKQELDVWFVKEDHTPLKMEEDGTIGGQLRDAMLKVSNPDMMSSKTVTSLHTTATFSTPTEKPVLPENVTEYATLDEYMQAY